MRIPFDVNRTVPFSFPDDQEPKTVYQLGFFDVALRTHIMEQMSDVNIDKSGQTVRFWVEVVRYGLKGWNLSTPDGAEVPFETDEHNIPGVGLRTRVTDGTLNRIDPSDIVPLGVELFRMNVPMKDKEARKN